MFQFRFLVFRLMVIFSFFTIIPAIAGSSPDSHNRNNLLMASGSRSSPFEPLPPSDINFVTDQGPLLDTGCIYRSQGPITFDVTITRYVGEVNSDGTLKNAQSLVDAGLLSSEATLIMPVYDVDSGASMTPPQKPEIDRVLFNGEEIGFLSGENNVWKLNSFKIPIEKVKFANKAANGASPAGAANRVEIDIDTGNAPLNQELWCTAVDWGALSFKAMSPIILIHGNNSNGAFFQQQGFTGALAARKLLFDNSINLPTDTIRANGMRLDDEIASVVKSFGVDSAHLVVHSKGGLDSREYLAKYQPKHNDEYKILSYTSLSTPHNGSLAADLKVQRDIAAQQGADIEYQGFPNFTRLISWWVNGDIGTTNLTTGFVASFNSSNINLLPSSVIFNTVAADADQNGNGRIDGKNPDERAETGQPAWAVDVVYQILRNTSAINVSYRTEKNSWGGTKTIATLTAVPSSTPLGNDVLVTIPSGRGDGSMAARTTNSRTFNGVNGRNHASVANAGVASTVIPWIIQVEKTRGDLK